MACPVGGKQCESKFYAVLWGDKPDRVKRINITQSYQKGGLKMINLDFFVKAMKFTWIRRLVLSQNTKWATLFQNQCCPIRRLLDYDPQGVYTIVSKAKKKTILE